MRRLEEDMRMLADRAILENRREDDHESGLDSFDAFFDVRGRLFMGHKEWWEDSK